MPSPFIVGFGFIGDIGASDLPASTPPIYGTGISVPQVPSANYFGASIWSQTIINGLIGTAFSLGQNPSRGQIDNAVGLYAQKAIKDGGIFSALIPGAKTGFLNADTYQHVSYGSGIGHTDTDLPPEFVGNLNGVLAAYNQLQTSSQLKGGIIFDYIPGDKVVIFGALSNKDVQLGAGNNIFMASSVMPVYSYAILQVGPQFNYQDQLDNKSTAEIFYPSAQGLYGTNTITAGNGNNLIYYDSSFQTIKTGSGNNVFAPSFGSFNWAANYLQVSATGNLEVVAGPSQSMLFTPTPISAMPSGNATTDNIYYSVTNWEGLTVKGSPPNLSLSAQFNRAFLNYVGPGGGGAPNTPSNAGRVDGSKANNIGGETIYGGSGSDTFYGADPTFYGAIPIEAVGTGSNANRFVYVLPTGNSTNERFSLQNFTTITMLGGGGNNSFYLGNPTTINTDASQYSFPFSYIISASHDYIATESIRGTLGFGTSVSAASNINLNLTTDVNSYISQTLSFTPDPSLGNTTKDNATQALAVGKAMYAGYKAVSMFGGPVTFGIADIASSLVDLTSNIVKLIEGNKTPPAPVNISTTMLSQPLGNWQKTVLINDWNPFVKINIDVTPTIANPNGRSNWANAQLKIGNPENITGSDPGVNISYTQADSKEFAILRLTGLGDPRYGYYSYDFTQLNQNLPFAVLTGSYKEITQNNLNFFGTIDNGTQAINALNNYQAGNGFIFSSSASPTTAMFGASQSKSFYWSDLAALGQKTLADAQAAASHLSVEFDSRSLGWYWDVKLLSTSTLANPLTDNANSKLWIKSSGNWTYYSFDTINTKTFAFENSLLAHTYYQVGSNSNAQISLEQASVNKTVLALDSIYKFAPNITDFNTKTLTGTNQIVNISAATQGGKSGFDIFYRLDPKDLGSKVVEIFTYQGADGKAVTVNAASDQVSLAAVKSAITVDQVVQLSTLPSIGIKANGALNNSGVNSLSGLDKVAATDAKIVANLVETLYRDVLGRAPDSGGASYFANQLSAGVSKSAVLTSLINSSELQSQFSTDVNYIRNVYYHLLGRTADSGGLDYWLNQANTTSRSDIVKLIANSTEHAVLINPS